MPESTAPGFEVVDVSAVHDERWRSFVTSRPSDVFHSPEWCGVLADTYDFDVRGRLLEQAGRPVAGWAVVQVDDMLGRRHVGLPFSDFCDPLVDDTAQLSALLESVDPNEPLTVKSRVCDVPSGVAGLTESGTLAWHGISVSDDPESDWTAIDASARRAIRRGLSAGVSVRASRELSDLRRFFELHLSVRKHKYRLLPQPWRFFEAIWRRFLEPGNGVLMLAECDDRTIGGVVFLEWGDRLYYKFNASDLDHLDARPNDLALWEGIRYASAHGLSLVDLGVSDLDQPGLIRYKNKYAAEAGSVTVHHRSSPVLPASAGEIRALLGSMTELYVDPSVPDAVTERAGDELYRYFV